MQVRNRDGYETAFAILRLGLLSEWIIAKAKSIPAGDIRIGRFEVHAIRDLQDRVNEAFPSVVADHARELLMKRTAEVEEALLAGRILERYEETGRGESCLVAGFTEKAKPIHIVCGTRGEWLAVITVYVPRPPKFKTPYERGEK